MKKIYLFMLLSVLMVNAGISQVVYEIGGFSGIWVGSNITINSTSLRLHSGTAGWGAGPISPLPAGDYKMIVRASTKKSGLSLPFYLNTTQTNGGTAIATIPIPRGSSSTHVQKDYSGTFTVGTGGDYSLVFTTTTWMDSYIYKITIIGAEVLASPDTVAGKNLDGAAVEISLQRAVFNDTTSLVMSNFTVLESGVPSADISVDTVIYISQTKANVILNYAGASFTSDKTIAIAVDSSEISRGADIVSNNVCISAPLSASISPAANQVIVVDSLGAQLSVSANKTPEKYQWMSSQVSGSSYNVLIGDTLDKFIPQFNSLDTFYIVCRLILGTDTAFSNEVQVITESLLQNFVTPSADQALLVNQTGGQLLATPNKTVSSYQWMYASSLSGPYSAISDSTNATLTPAFSLAGTYFVKCEASTAYQTASSNVVKIIVEDSLKVNITPDTNQTLEENTPGTTIAAIPNIAVTNYQWKYSTTSGSGYVNLSDTDSLYTPQFMTADTYYIVCEATNGVQTELSNEVQIVVEITTEIVNHFSEEILVYPVPTSNVLYVNGVQEGECIQIKTITGITLIVSYSNAIDVSGLPEGVYLLEVNNMIVKFIKK